jgi:hypothetical protein
MSGTALDSLIKSVTVIFVLSLAVERLASLFKSRNIQPLRLLRRWKKSGFRVDLATGSVVEMRNGQPDPVSSTELCRAHTKAVNSENTVFLGVLLAVLTGANALDGLPGVGQLKNVFPGWTGPGAYLLVLPGVLLTGAAAAVGSSFWYDLLGLLVEARRTKQALGSASRELSAPGADLSSLKDRSLLFRKTREEARKQVEALRLAGTITRGAVIDIPLAPYLALQLEGPAGATLPTEVTVQVEGQSLALPVERK